MFPGFDWNAYLAATGVTDKVSDVVLCSGDVCERLRRTSSTARRCRSGRRISDGRCCATTRRFLDKAVVDERFAFYGTTLRGTPRVQEERWKRGVRMVDAAMGENLGKIYVAENFPARNKASMEKLVQESAAGLQAKYQYAGLDEPGHQDRGASASCSTFVTKIGYPVKWKDWSKLAHRQGRRISRQSAARQARSTPSGERGQAGQTDQGTGAWLATSPTPSLQPEMNEIVFPAAILQPPLLNAAADDAVERRRRGRTIGHEIRHGFDGLGQPVGCDGDGNLREMVERPTTRKR